MSKAKPAKYISTIDAKKIAVKGDLSLKTARCVYEESLCFAGQDTLPIEIDLSEVGYVDSAGMALLLEWQSWAHRHDHHFCFGNAPEHLLKLATLSDAEHLLDFQKICDAELEEPPKVE